MYFSLTLERPDICWAGLLCPFVKVFNFQKSVKKLSPAKIALLLFFEKLKITFSIPNVIYSLLKNWVHFFWKKTHFFFLAWNIFSWSRFSKIPKFKKTFSQEPRTIAIFGKVHLTLCFLLLAKLHFYSDRFSCTQFQILIFLRKKSCTYLELFQRRTKTFLWENSKDEENPK